MLKSGKVASDQGVRYVLEGSVRKSGNRLRITAQLIDAINNKHCWVERYDRDLDDVFEIQEEIARNVSVAVQVKLTAGDTAKIWAGGTTNVEAWESFVRGNAYMEDHVKEHNKEAKRLAELALSLDPDYANAWVLLGFTNYEDSHWKWSEVLMSHSCLLKKLRVKAIELEELNPDGYVLLGAVQVARNDFTQAARNTRKAYLLAPNSSHNLASYAWLQNREGEYRKFNQVHGKSNTPLSNSSPLVFAPPKYKLLRYRTVMTKLTGINEVSKTSRSRLEPAY